MRSMFMTYLYDKISIKHERQCFIGIFKTRQDKTRQLYLTRVAQSAARLVSLGALGSIKFTYTHYNTHYNKQHREES